MASGERGEGDWGTGSCHLRRDEGRGALRGLHGNLHERVGCGFIKGVCGLCWREG